MYVLVVVFIFIGEIRWNLLSLLNLLENFIDNPGRVIYFGVLYSALLRKINIAIKSRSIAIYPKNKRKTLNLQHKQQKCHKINISYTPKEVVHNFSSYALSREEHDALSHGLEHHIPSKVTRNSVSTEFESFHHRLLHNISTVPEEKI